MYVDRVGGSEPMRDHNFHDSFVFICVHSGFCTVYLACVYVHWCLLAIYGITCIYIRIFSGVLGCSHKDGESLFPQKLLKFSHNQDLALMKFGHRHMMALLTCEEGIVVFQLV